MKQVVCKEEYIQNWKGIGELVKAAVIDGCIGIGLIGLLIIGSIPLLLCGIVGLHPAEEIHYD